MIDNVLKLRGALISELPKDYSYQGSLDLTKSDIIQLPENLFVKEDLIIQDCMVDNIPANSIIGRNLIYNGPEMITIHPTALICGNVIFNGNILPAPASENDRFIYLEDGTKFYYESRKFYAHDSTDHRYDRTPFYVYLGYSNSSPWVVTFETKTGIHKKFCRNTKEAKYQVNYQVALENGMEQYRDLDINELMLGHDILKIYTTCATHACEPEVEKFLKMFNLSLDNKYTLREIGYKIQEFKLLRYAPGSEVFMNFFNIPSINQKRD